jgi:hypothetical protein
MKIKLLVSFLFFAKITFAQISKGEFSFEILDSISHEYSWKKAEDYCKKHSLDLEKHSDTTVILDKNYTENIWIVSKDNYKQQVLSHYDIFSEKFNQNYSIGSNDYWQFITDLDKKITSSYKKINQNKYEFGLTVKMLGLRKQGKISDLKIDKQDIIFYKNYKGYKIEYIEQFENEEDKIVKMYVTEAIEYPILMFVNYPEDLRHCPLYLEYYKKSEPKNKIIYRLLSIKDIDKDTEIQHLIKLVGQN